MAEKQQPNQLVQAIANGDGEWAGVPRSVRHSVMMSLQQQYERPPPRRPVELPSLTEGMVQRSVETFEDGAWVRDQAVRSFAQFHNSIETLHTSMKGQLESLLRTAMQLHPEILADVQDHFHLRRSDEIPDGVPIDDDKVERIGQQEQVLEELMEDLHQLRNTSVRFAAHFLTDTEKRAMGANPAYLRAEDMDRDAEMRAERSSRAASHSAPAPGRRGSSPGASPPTALYPELERHPTSPFNRVSKDDPYLTELRRQYMMRVAELNGLDGHDAYMRGAKSHPSGSSATSQTTAESKKKSRRKS